MDTKRMSQRNKKAQTEIELNVDFLDEKTQPFNLTVSLHESAVQNHQTHTFPNILISL